MAWAHKPYVGAPGLQQRAVVSAMLARMHPAHLGHMIAPTWCMHQLQVQFEEHMCRRERLACAERANRKWIVQRPTRRAAWQVSAPASAPSRTPRLAMQRWNGRTPHQNGITGCRSARRGQSPRRPPRARPPRPRPQTPPPRGSSSQGLPNVSSASMPPSRRSTDRRAAARAAPPALQHSLDPPCWHVYNMNVYNMCTIYTRVQYHDRLLG